eukprot:6206368-Pleurochrysis_carterae.AAC.2
MAKLSANGLGEPPYDQGRNTGHRVQWRARHDACWGQNLPADNSGQIVPTRLMLHGERESHAIEVYLGTIGMRCRNDQALATSLQLSPLSP